MKIFLDEIFSAGKVSQLHPEKKIKCSPWRSKVEARLGFEFNLDESSFVDDHYSCEPGKFPRDYFNITRWQGRYTVSGRKKLPKDKDIKILGRARKRVPFSEIAKALFLYRKKSVAAGDPNFSTKIPENIGQLFPELDLTIDLFYNNNNLTGAEIQKSLYRHIKENRIPEYIGCSKGFVIMYNVGIQDYKKIETQLNASLSELFSKTGIMIPLEKNNEDMSKFFFLVYFAFPDQLEKHLVTGNKNNNIVAWIEEALNNLDEIVPLKTLPNPSKTNTIEVINRDAKSDWALRKNELKFILNKALNKIKFNEPFEDKYVDTYPAIRYEKKFIVELKKSFKRCKTKKQFFGHVYRLYIEIETQMHRNAVALSFLVENVYPKDRLWNTQECIWLRFIAKYFNNPNNIYYCFKYRFTDMLKNCNI